MSGSELLDHVGELSRGQREAEVAILRAAAQHAYLHNRETLDPEVAELPGRERAVRLGGHGTPLVAEFAAAAFGARIGLSTFGARQLIADALDLQHRFPRLWARVQGLEVKVSYARLVTRKARDLTRVRASCVDERVAESADGRISWSRFELLVEAAVKAADPEAAAEREEQAARVRYARATRPDGHGMRGFCVRAGFAVIARLDATVGYLAEVLAALGDDSSVDERRVKAVLVLANPAQAVELLAAFAAWKDRPEDPQGLVDHDARHNPSRPDRDNPDRGGPRTGGRPTDLDWSALLPTVRLFVHLYGGPAGDRVARVEGCGPMSEAWLRSRLGPVARFRVTPVLDLAGQAPVDSYEIPERHRQAVRLMTPADTFPFASCLSREQQIDHTIAYDHGRGGGGGAPPGQSRIGNYGPMTLGHHRIKTHGRWQVQQPFPGIYVWRDPHGGFYLVDHTGTRRIGAVHDTADGPTPRPLTRLETHLADLAWQPAA